MLVFELGWYGIQKIVPEIQSLAFREIRLKKLNLI